MNIMLHTHFYTQFAGYKKNRAYNTGVKYNRLQNTQAMLFFYECFCKTMRQNPDYIDKFTLISLLFHYLITFRTQAIRHRGIKLVKKQ